LEDPIAEEILKGELSEGDIMKVDFDKETSQITIIDEKGESKTPTEEETK